MTRITSTKLARAIYRSKNINGKRVRHIDHFLPPAIRKPHRCGYKDRRGNQCPKVYLLSPGQHVVCDHR